MQKQLRLKIGPNENACLVFPVSAGTSKKKVTNRFSDY